MPGLRSSADLKRFVSFGSGVGIEIREKNLEVTAVRVRPNGIAVLGSTTICNYAERPAAEWGAEYGRFLEETGATHLAATVLLPRRETIVRQIALPGVSARDLASAIALQIDTLHPYGEDDVVYGWSPLENGGVLIGILRRADLDRYMTLFVEAGVAVASFTFSAAAIYTARRVPVSQAEIMGGGFAALATGENGAVEVYGESSARPVFSAEFDLPTGRAAAAAVSELRLEPESLPVPLERALPVPRSNPVSNDLARRALPYAAALAGACPWLRVPANLLPPEHRRTNSRAMYVPTAILAVVVLGLMGALVAYSSIEDRNYLADLDRQIARLEPQAKLAAKLDQQMAHAHNQVRLLDQFRGRTKADLDALNELTALIAPPTWASMIDLTPDAATITGETEQAAPLLKILDASPYFQNSAFVGSLAKSGGNEQFQIRAARQAHR
ncbi:MAG TPA: PilN domain-containing protein [Bryobacteraceae bacterium]|nr:PilN domain-containing protein [Bryobacteraceae bacterium]